MSLKHGVRWPDGAFVRADVILWCTGFRSSLDHLAPLMLREPTVVSSWLGGWPHRWQRSHGFYLVGYGPSASTIGEIEPARLRQAS